MKPSYSFCYSFYRMHTNVRVHTKKRTQGNHESKSQPWVAYIWIFVLSLGWILPSAVVAQSLEEKGTETSVLWSQGDVRIVGDEEIILSEKGHPLKEGHEVLTVPNSRCVVSLEDIPLVINQFSSVSFLSLKSKVHLRLNRGSLLGNYFEQAQVSQFLLSTTKVELDIRRAKFFMDYVSDSQGKFTVIRIMVYEGEIYAVHQNYPDQAITIPKGKKVYIYEDKAPDSTTIEDLEQDDYMIIQGLDDFLAELSCNLSNHDTTKLWQKIGFLKTLSEEEQAGLRGEGQQNDFLIRGLYKNPENPNQWYYSKEIPVQIGFKKASTLNYDKLFLQINQDQKQWYSTIDFLDQQEGSFLPNRYLQSNAMTQITVYGETKLLQQSSPIYVRAYLDDEPPSMEIQVTIPFQRFNKPAKTSFKTDKSKMDGASSKPLGTEIECQCAYQNNGIYYVSKQHQIFIHAFDRESGIAPGGVSYRFNNESTWTVFDGNSIAAPKPEWNILEVVAKDLVGNSTQKQSLTIFVDDTPPHVDISVDEPGRFDQENNMYELLIGSRVYFKPLDLESGVMNLYYKVEPYNEWQIYDKAVEFHEIGIYSIQYYCEDQVRNRFGNKQAPNSIQIEVIKNPMNEVLSTVK